VKRLGRVSLDRTGYLTLREAAEWLGIGDTPAAARRLQRLVEAREREGRGRVILVRRGEGRGQRLLVTRASLRLHLPELWDPGETLLEVVREHLGAIEGELERGRIERRVMGRKVAALLSQVNALSLEQRTTPPPERARSAFRALAPATAHRSTKRAQGGSEEA